MFLFLGNFIYGVLEGEDGVVEFFVYFGGLKEYCMCF